MGILDGVRNMFRGEVPSMTWKEQCRANKQYCKNRGTITTGAGKQRGMNNVLRGLAIEARENRRRDSVPFNKHKADKQIAGLEKINTLWNRVGISVL